MTDQSSSTNNGILHEQLSWLQSCRCTGTVFCCANPSVPLLGCDFKHLNLFWQAFITYGEVSGCLSSEPLTSQELSSATHFIEFERGLLRGSAAEEMITKNRFEQFNQGNRGLSHCRYFVQVAGEVQTPKYKEVHVDDLFQPGTRIPRHNMGQLSWSCQVHRPPTGCVLYVIMAQPNSHLGKNDLGPLRAVTGEWKVRRQGYKVPWNSATGRSYDFGK